MRSEAKGNGRIRKLGMRRELQMFPVSGGKMAIDEMRCDIYRGGWERVIVRPYCDPLSNDISAGPASEGAGW